MQIKSFEAPVAHDASHDRRNRIQFAWSMVAARRFGKGGCGCLQKSRTLVRRHRSSFCLYWRWQSPPSCRPACGPGPRTISRDNPLSDAPSIYGCAETRDRHCPVDRRQVHAQASRRALSGLAAFLRNYTAHIAAVDLFVVPAIGFRQGCSAPFELCRRRAYRVDQLARRSPSSVRSDGIIGRHRHRAANVCWSLVPARAGDRPLIILSVSLIARWQKIDTDRTPRAERPGTFHSSQVDERR